MVSGYHSPHLAAFDGVDLSLLTRSLGFLYEMGGTWVTHHMGYPFREMVRYGMDRDLITTGIPNVERGYYTINVAGKQNIKKQSAE